MVYVSEEGKFIFTILRNYVLIYILKTFKEFTPPEREGKILGIIFHLK